MKNKIEKKQDSNTPLEANGVFEVEKESTKKGVEDTLKIEKIVISEKEIKNILKEKRVVQRITLLRHYPYKEESSKNIQIIKDYNELIDKKFRGEEVDSDILNKLSKIVDTLTYKTFEEIPDEKIKQVIKNTLLSKDKSIFLYSKIGKERVRITGDDLVSKFGLNNIGEIDLTGSTPSDNLGDVFINMSSQLLKEYNRIKNVYKNYNEIIIIGNRTYSYGMNFISGDGDVTIRESEKDFEKQGYIFHEYNESGKILRNTGNIIVTPENYEDFKKIFDIEHSSIIDFQNKLNVYLIKNPELIKRYVKSEIEELRKYSLLKLVERRELETLNEIFREEKFRKSIILEDYERLDKKVYTILRYYLEVYYKVLEIRNRSLDKRIKNGENIEPHFNFDREEYNEILELINTGKPIKYIEGKAGAGKSFLLTYIAEKLNEENLNNNKLQKLYYPVYISLSGKGLESLDDISYEDIDKDYEVVYLIDSIDESEIYGEERKELDKKLLSLSKKGKVIITSRSGYLIKYDDENNQEKVQKELLKNNQEIIEVQDFTIEQIDDYLEKYFGENTSNITKTKNILLKLNGAGNNPLILSMVCEVVNNGELKNEDGEVINLKNITIIDIYSNIVELRLGEWNENINGRDVNKKGNIEEKRKKGLINKKGNLSQIAYLQLLDGKNLKLNQLDEIIDDENLDIESLNLLFRKGEDGEYDFVHQSFKEYFAAKYIFEEMKNNSVFDYEDLLCQGLKKVDINFLEMLVNFIQTDEKLKEKFLEEINENESYFPQCIHHKIVFLLGNLKIKQVKGLLQNYYIDIDMYNILKKYNITNLLSDNNNGISEDVKISYIVYLSKGLDTIEQVRTLYIRFRKLLNFNGYNIGLLEELIENINIKFGTDNNRIFFILTNLFLLFDYNYHISYRLLLLKKISLLNSQFKEDFFNKILNNENDIQIKIKILKIKQNIFGINIDSKLKEIFNNTKKINIKLECIYVKPDLITKNELYKIFFPYISYSNINFGYYNEDVSRLINFRLKLIGTLEYFLNEENYITFLLNEINNPYYDEVKNLCSYLLYNFFKKKTKEELLIIFNGTDNFFVKRSIVESLGYKSFDIKTLTPILEFSIDKGIYNFEIFIGYITDSEREKIYIEISQYSEKLRNTFGLYGSGKTFKEEFDENIKYIYNVIEKKYDFTLIRDIIYGFSIYGGKKAINFLRHLFLNNKQNDLKRYCIFCLKQIGGRANLKFIEQHKDFFEEE